MKLKLTLAMLLLLSVFLFAACGEKNNNGSDDPIGDKKVFNELTNAEFAVKSEEFLTITNYLSMIGADFSLNNGDVSVSASLDLSVVNDIMLALDIELGDKGLAVFLGGAKLYVSVGEKGSEQKDSMSFDNNLTNIMKDIGKGDTYIELLSYLTADIGSLLVGEDFDMNNLNTDGIENIIKNSTVLYYDGEKTDEYMILANVDYDGKTYESELPGTVDVRFSVNGGCITSLSGNAELDGKKTAVSFKRRTVSSLPLEEPENPTSYNGTVLDRFEELYTYRNLTFDDFKGEWLSVDYTLNIGDEIKLVSESGELVLVYESQLSNCLVLTAGEDVYVLRLNGDLELHFPDGMTLILEKGGGVFLD